MFGPASNARVIWRMLPALLVLGTGIPALAEAPDPSPVTSATLDRGAATEQSVGAFIDEKLAIWRQRLKLENWYISVALTRRDALKPRTLGGIRWDKRKKTAQIAVMDPADYRLSHSEMLKDIEFTIVHELVHLELASLPRSEASRSNEEYAVNQIAEALLRLAKE